ncbi:MAG: hypothetical protein ACREOH_11415 [Candidatus Entotheonellia bacterium]
MSFIEDMKNLAEKAAAEKRHAYEATLKAEAENISAQCKTIADQVAKDVEDNARGQVRFPQILGHLLYHLSQDARNLGENRIQATPGFQALRDRCQELGLTLELERHYPEVEWDSKIGMDLAEPSYLITVSGWGPHTKQKPVSPQL